MIQPLRTIHRRAFIGLAVVLPVILLVGLGARRPRPAGRWVPDIATQGDMTRKSDAHWRKHAIRSGFYIDRKQAPDRYVVFEAGEDLSEPDVLLYWAGSEPAGGSLPPQAQLLGALPGTTFLLPSDARAPGYLVLYSLAHQAVIDTAAVENLP